MFSGVGKTAAEMDLALAEDILCFNIESEPELALLAERAQAAGRTARVSFRINPDVDAKTHAKISTGKKADKFGIPFEQAARVYAAAAALDGIEVTGIDMHIGSQIVDLEPFDLAFAKLADLVRQLRSDGHTINHVDVGGGLGIPYRDDNNPPPDPDAYAAIVHRHVDDLDAKVIFEPGRLIAGNAGVFVTEVLYVKEGDDRMFVIVDGAMNDLIRPTLYDAWHEVRPVDVSRPIPPVSPPTSWGRYASRRLFCQRARDGQASAGRSPRTGFRGGLRRGAGGHLQHPCARAGSAGGRRPLPRHPPPSGSGGADCHGFRARLNVAHRACDAHNKGSVSPLPFLVLDLAP